MSLDQSKAPKGQRILFKTRIKVSAVDSERKNDKGSSPRSPGGEGPVVQHSGSRSPRQANTFKQLTKGMLKIDQILKGNQHEHQIDAGTLNYLISPMPVSSKSGSATDGERFQYG